MSGSNAEEFRRRADAFNAGDFETWIDGFTEDVEFIAARSAVEGTFRGHDGLRKFLADNAETFEVFELRADEIQEFGDRILVIGSIRIRPRGVDMETELPVAGVVDMRDGRAVRWEDFRERRLALEALGLSG